MESMLHEQVAGYKDGLGAEPFLIPAPGNTPDGIAVVLRRLADTYPGAPRLETWCVTLPVLPGARAEVVPKRLHSLAVDALMACRVFRVDKTCREVAERFLDRAVLHKRAGGQLRAMDRAMWHDIYGESDVELAKQHDMHLAEGRHQREKIREGRKFLHDLGAWPWVLFENGKLPRNWWTLEASHRGLAEWSLLGGGMYVLWPGLESPQPGHGPSL